MLAGISPGNHSTACNCASASALLVTQRLFLKSFSSNIYIVGTFVNFVKPSGATAFGATFAQQQMRFVLVSWVAVTADHHPFEGLCFLVVAVLSEVLCGPTNCREGRRTAFESTSVFVFGCLLPVAFLQVALCSGQNLELCEWCLRYIDRGCFVNVPPVRASRFPTRSEDRVDGSRCGAHGVEELPCGEVGG